MKACSFNTGWTCRHLLEEGPAVPVTLPHDAAMDEPRTETAPGGTNTGWYEGFDYLYEKRFTPEAALQGQTLTLEFEGVYHTPRSGSTAKSWPSTPTDTPIVRWT